MKKFLKVILIIGTIAILSINTLAASYSGVSHSLTSADTFGYRKETMTIKNNQNETIEIDATVKIYVNNSFIDGNYLSDYRLASGRTKTISTGKFKNTNYGKYSYSIVSNSGSSWAYTGTDY